MTTLHAPNVLNREDLCSHGDQYISEKIFTICHPITIINNLMKMILLWFLFPPKPPPAIPLHRSRPLVTMKRRRRFRRFVK